MDHSSAGQPEEEVEAAGGDVLQCYGYGRCSRIVVRSNGGLLGGDQMTVNFFFSSLSKEADDEGNLSYPLLTRLESAISTI